VGRPPTAPRDPKGWPRLLAAPGRQLQLLTWLYDWVETAGTGGGFFRSMYAEFLEEAAGPLGRPGLTTLAGSYRELATAWTTLAETARDAAGPQPSTPTPSPPCWPACGARSSTWPRRSGRPPPS
jgi:hypothetical protein